VHDLLCVRPEEITSEHTHWSNQAKQMLKKIMGEQAKFKPLQLDAILACCLEP
jgi:hypothetical protein